MLVVVGKGEGGRGRSRWGLRLRIAGGGSTWSQSMIVLIRCAMTRSVDLAKQRRTVRCTMWSVSSSMAAVASSITTTCSHHAHANTQIRTCTRTHAHTHTRTHAHTRTQRAAIITISLVSPHHFSHPFPRTLAPRLPHVWHAWHAHSQPLEDTGTRVAAARGHLPAGASRAPRRRQATDEPQNNMGAHAGCQGEVYAASTGSIARVWFRCSRQELHTPFHGW